MFKFEVLEDGSLRITHDNHEELKELLERFGSDETFFNESEDYWTNGWGVFRADDLGYMSQCIMISEEYDLDENAKYTVPNGVKVWSNIHNYQIVCPIEHILEFGYFDFLSEEN